MSNDVVLGAHVPRDHDNQMYDAKREAPRTTRDDATELIALRAAMDELIACKDMQDRYINAWMAPAESCRLITEISRREPLAWAEARRLRGKT